MNLIKTHEDYTRAILDLYDYINRVTTVTNVSIVAENADFAISVLENIKVYKVMESQGLNK